MTKAIGTVSCQTMDQSENSKGILITNETRSAIENRVCNQNDNKPVKMDQTTCEQLGVDTKPIKVVRFLLDTSNEQDHVMPIVSWKELDSNDIYLYESYNKVVKCALSNAEALNQTMLSDITQCQPQLSREASLVLPLQRAIPSQAKPWIEMDKTAMKSTSESK